MLKYNALIFYFFAVTTFAYSQTKSSAASKWADSVLNNMSRKEKIGQLFMVAAYSNKDTTHLKHLDSLVKSCGIGGIIFFQGGPKRQIYMTNKLQNSAKVKLLVGIDAEWGLNMRLDSTMYFPKQMTLASGCSKAEVYDMAQRVAAHCKRIGVHVNFAPVADVNNNPANPVIGMRSFSESKHVVSQLATAYMKGMQHAGIMACGKHFPGHGDTDTDSHHGLPVIKQSLKRLHELELYPFKDLIKDSLQSMMVAHIHVPAIDNRQNIATTLSPDAVNKLLKKDLKFNGLVFTDALNMKGVSKYYKPGEVELMALKAGNDILLFAENVPAAIQKIDSAFNTGELDSNEVYKSVKKILSAKYMLNVPDFKPIDTTNIYHDLNSHADMAARQAMYEKSMLILKNESNAIPIKQLDQEMIASICINSTEKNTFQNTIDLYCKSKHFHLHPNQSIDVLKSIVNDSLKNYTTIVVCIHALNNNRKKKYNLNDSLVSVIKSIKKKCIITLFGNPYAASYFEDAQNLIIAYEDNKTTQHVVPQLIFGAIGTQASLPVSVSNKYTYGSGVSVKSIGRLRYAYPETIGLKSEKFKLLDSIVTAAIQMGATPGAQLQISKDGVVVYQKNFGHLSYDRQTTVQTHTLYDLASVTKVAASMQALMLLHDWKKIDVEKNLEHYLPELRNTNKAQIIIKDMLLHQAGLLSSLELWKKLPQDHYIPKKSASGLGYKPLSANLWVRPQAADSVYGWVIKSKLLEPAADTGCFPYKYSDLGFYFVKKITEKFANQSMASFLTQNIYLPLGAHNLQFEPSLQCPISTIAPTEEDNLFRQGIVQGYVHDPQAAICGGVAGHAGLFSNANSLNILGQMHLQQGTYAGTKYFNKNTISWFSKKKYFSNRRAIGWDRPFPPDEISLASDSAYGHTGFTGTAWWIDPQYQLVFTFLSNRTYPFADNKRLTTWSIRTKVLNAAYQALK